MSKPAPLIVLAGGSGFVGRHLASRLAAHGYRIRILTRDCARARDLRVLPTLEILAHPAIYEPDATLRAVQGAHLLINLVGALHEARGPTRKFEWTHVGITRNLVEAAERAGVRHYLHVSALGTAAAQPRSRYLMSKARAEACVRSSSLDWALVRPSVIYGPDDDFLMRFATLLRLAPGIFPLTCPESRLAPVDIEDVVEALSVLIREPALDRRTYDLEGPESRTLLEIVRAIADLLGVRCRIVGLSDGMSWLMGAVLERLPHPPFTRDNYWTLKAEESVGQGELEAARCGFERLGIEPQPFLDRAAVYLRRFHPAGPGPLSAKIPRVTGSA